MARPRRLLFIWVRLDTGELPRAFMAERSLFDFADPMTDEQQDAVEERLRAFRAANPVRDYVRDPLQVVSFGGGTQSTAMLLMIRDGALPRPDIVIFADTGSELPETMQHIEEVARPFIEEELGLPFFVVTSHRGALHDAYMEKRAIPMKGIRSCTTHHKILPQRRKVREIVGKKNGVRLAEMWLGITTDEARRRTTSDVKWASLRYPLLDDVPMTRDECIALNEANGWEVVKSGCFCCPYAGAKAYRDLRDTHPELFAICVEMERLAHERQKEEGKTLRSGLCWERALDDLDELPERYNEDSQCDADIGCFI